MTKNLSLTRRLIQSESVSGIVLFLSAAIAITLANSHWSKGFAALWNTNFSPAFPFTPLFIINEGLMTFFFLLVGLELKHALLHGGLRERSQVLLPLVAALGGMLVPALVYSYFNYQHPQAFVGWAIPVATDVAFALGVLALFNGRIAPSLKIFLMALAIFDDIGSILIIAFFYALHFSAFPLFCALALYILGYILNRIEVRRLSVYIVLGLLLWLCILQSGIHPSISGVLLALLIPDEPEQGSLLRRMEHALQPWVAFAVMPLFALANAGFPLATLPAAESQVGIGIILGLFLGKQLGILSSCWALLRSGWAKLPNGASWLELWGVSILCGIGFTMSLFLGTLAFIDSEFYMIEVRLGVFIGSILSGIMGAVVLFLARKAKG